jgi:hypothetical protein
MGIDNHVVSYKLCGFQGCAGGRIVMMEKPVVVAPKFHSFSFHIFSQVSQNVRVKVRVRRCVGRRKKFTTKKTMSMLFVDLWTYCTFFALGDCELFHCDNCCFVSGSRP